MVIANAAMPRLTRSPRRSYIPHATNPAAPTPHQINTKGPVDSRAIALNPNTQPAAILAVTIAGKLSLATSLLLRGIAAIIEAYLIYWAVVYFVARKWFGFSREWAAPLASGISICGVSAAIATGAAIRSRPIVPVLVSSLVVIFAVVEVLILPVLAQTFLSHQPLVAAAWIGLAG